MSWNAELAVIARAHLSADDAEAWISLLRPAIWLAHHDGSGAPVAARLGGDPELPPETAWPVWPGRGPLAFIASLDCAAVTAAGELDIPFPVDGTLLFFYFDGRFAGDAAMVFYADATTQAGAAVLYIPAGTPTQARPAPEGIEPYPAIGLCARQVASEPGWEHPRMLDAFSEGEWGVQEIVSHPVTAKPFTEAVEAVTTPSEERHRVGGWAVPVQGPVEHEIVTAALGGGNQRRDALAAEERAWVLLAQFDSDHAARMMWGDVGTLYWMIRPEDLAARRFDKALFTWQCC